MTGAGNAARAFVRTVVTFSGMALNASATLAFGVATLGRDTAIWAINLPINELTRTYLKIGS